MMDSQWPNKKNSTSSETSNLNKALKSVSGILLYRSQKNQKYRTWEREFLVKNMIDT